MDQNKRVALLTAIDLGNLTRAAEQLGYTQSGLSYVIKALEAELGFPLLVRSRAGVRPTDECQRILPLLRELDRKSRQLEQEAADIRGLAVGNVFIATFPSISRFWLPQILRDFAQLYPGITVSIRESGQEEQDEWLREGAIDLAFCSYHDSPYHWIPFLEDEIWAAVPAVQYHMDEPLADAAAVALYFLNREAAREVKVCLSGEGADELFGGYNIYRDPFTAQWYNRLPPWLRGGLGAAAGLLPPGPGVNFLVRRGCPLEERYFGPTALMTEREKRRLLADYEGDGDPMFLTEALWDSTEGLDPVSRMQQVDINLWLAGDILLKADKMSMAHSLELRVPFLDREVFALAAALPAAAKADARMTKIALRQAAARTLPPASAARKKLGFPVPVRDWLRQEPYTSRVRAAFARPAAAQFFRPQVLHSMLNRHLHGGDCWRQIWCVYSFLIWYEQFFGA